MTAGCTASAPAGLAVKPVVKKVEEKMLTDPETLNLIAEKKSNAIIVFLKKSE